MLVPILGLLWAHSAAAVLIYSEGFNTNGAGTRYTVTGGGSSGGGTNYWARQSTVTSPAFAGQEGADYWAGRDLDEPFAGGVVPRTLQLPITGVNVTGYTGVTISILLAANTGVWDGSQIDSIRLYAVNYGAGGALTLLDTFLPTGALDTNMRSALFGTSLNLTFARYTYTVPVTIGNLGFRFTASSTGDLEYIGFDDVRIEGTVLVPEPAPVALLCIGLVILGSVGRAKPR
jgi:hypothetical protein